MSLTRRLKFANGAGDLHRRILGTPRQALTSSATTAKPRPWSPARAASMVAVECQQVGLVSDLGNDRQRRLHLLAVVAQLVDHLLQPC